MTARSKPSSVSKNENVPSGNTCTQNAPSCGTTTHGTVTGSVTATRRGRSARSNNTGTSMSDASAGNV